MARRSAQAMYEALHKDKPYHDGTFTTWHKERGPETPFHFNDGVEIWVSTEDLTPDDDFLSPPTPADPPAINPEGGD